MLNGSLAVRRTSCSLLIRSYLQQTLVVDRVVSASHHRPHCEVPGTARCSYTEEISPTATATAFHSGIATRLVVVPLVCSNLAFGHNPSAVMGSCETSTVSRLSGWLKSMSAARRSSLKGMFSVSQPLQQPRKLLPVCMLNRHSSSSMKQPELLPLSRQINRCHSHLQQHRRVNSNVTPIQATFRYLSAASKSSSDEDRNSKADSQAQKRLQDIRTALQGGRLGFGFSAGGFLYPYHLGVMWELHELAILKDYKVKMAGSSAGSLAVATYNCGLDVELATKALYEFAAECRTQGTRYRLGSQLRDFLHAYLPADAHERCRGNSYVAITRLFPYVRAEYLSEWRSKDDFVECLLTSCHIPFYFNGDYMTQYRENWYMDGGVAAFIPAPPTPYAVKVSCFPVHQVLSSVPEQAISFNARVASAVDIAISPDAFEAWPFSYQSMVTWALLPADDDMLSFLIAKGRRDAREWARRMMLIPGQEAAACPPDADVQVSLKKRQGGEGAQVVAEQAAVGRAASNKL